MASDLRKQVLLDLFVTPSTVVPLLGGGTLLLLSSILGGMSAFLGFVGLLLSFGALLTNVVFNLEGITKNAVKRMHRHEKLQRDSKLNSLDANLVKSKDPRDQTALRNLRALYDSFSDDLEKGRINANPNMIQLIEDIFIECVSKLETTWDLLVTSSKLSGRIRSDLVLQREKIIIDVENSVKTLAVTMTEVRALKFKTGENEMKRLREKLESQLEIAKNTQASVESLDFEKTFDEYDNYSQ